MHKNVANRQIERHQFYSKILCDPYFAVLRFDVFCCLLTSLSFGKGSLVDSNHLPQQSIDEKNEQVSMPRANVLANVYKRSKFNQFQHIVQSQTTLWQPVVSPLHSASDQQCHNQFSMAVRLCHAQIFLEFILGSFEWHKMTRGISQFAGKSPPPPPPPHQVMTPLK